MADASDDLYPLMSNMNETMARVRQDMQELRGTTESLQATMEQGLERLDQAIMDNIRAQAEMKLMEYQAEVVNAEAMVDAELEQIEREEEELDQTLETYSERYDQKEQELQEKLDDRIRDLGSHIFEVVEETFERGIEVPFLEHVSKLWDQIREHNLGLHGSKREEMETELEATGDEIDRFTARRRDLLDRIHQHQIQINPPDDPASLQIPYWVVTVERDGEQRREVVGPSELRSEEQEGWFGTRLESITGFEPVLEPLANRSVPTYPRQERSERLADAIEPRSETALGGLVSYRDAFEEVLPDRPQIMVESEEVDG